jgi:hypothetical protein
MPSPLSPSLPAPQTSSCSTCTQSRRYDSTEFILVADVTSLATRDQEKALPGKHNNMCAMMSSVHVRQVPLFRGLFLLKTNRCLSTVSAPTRYPLFKGPLLIGFTVPPFPNITFKDGVFCIFNPLLLWHLQERNLKLNFKKSLWAHKSK